MLLYSNKKSKGLQLQKTIPVESFGIGSILLKNMGWKEGEGLGPTGSGITQVFSFFINKY